MRGATIRAERALRARLREEASRRLGTGSTEAAIEEMTDRLYLGLVVSADAIVGGHSTG